MPMPSSRHSGTISSCMSARRAAGAEEAVASPACAPRAAPPPHPQTPCSAAARRHQGRTSASRLHRLQSSPSSNVVDGVGAAHVGRRHLAQPDVPHLALLHQLLHGAGGQASQAGEGIGVSKSAGRASEWAGGRAANARCGAPCNGAPAARPGAPSSPPSSPRWGWRGLCGGGSRGRCRGSAN